MMKWFLILCLGWSCVALADSASTNRNNHSVKNIVMSQCASCHSADGNSQNSLWPNIAGLKQSYILKQLKDFKGGLRVNKDVERITKSLTFKNLTALSYFFSQQKFSSLTKPKKLSESSELVNLSLGEEIYTGKRIEYGIPACASCHGERGQGGLDRKRGYIYPRLARQYKQYSIKQLQLFRESKRSNDSPAMMRNISLLMDDEDIESVMAYVATFNSNLKSEILK